MNENSILIVENQASDAADVAATLRRLGYAVAGIARGRDEAVDLVNRLRPSLILINIQLDDPFGGIAVAEAVRRQHDVPVIYLAAPSDSATLARAKATTPAGYLVRPFDDSDLGAQIEWARSKHPTERQLRESEQRYRIVADFMFDWEFWIRPDGRFEYVSPAVERITARHAAPNSIAADFVRLVVHPDDLPRRLAHLTEELAGHGPGEMEFRIVRPDGDVRWIEHHCQPIHDESGRFLGTRGSNRDITARKRTEETLRESEERLRLLGDNLPDSAVYQFVHEEGTSGRFTYFSAGIERLTGVRVEDVLRDSAALFQQMPPEYRERLMHEVTRCVREFLDFDMDVPLRRRDGEVRWMRLHSRPRRLADGTAVWDGVQMDITDRKRTEEVLAEQARLLDLSHDAILVRDTDDKITYWNHGAAEMYGYRRDEAIGSCSHDLLQTVFPEPLGHILEKLQRDGRWAGELTHTCKSGLKIIAISRWVLDRDAKGRPASILETNTDITERKQAEDALAKAKQDAENANMTKSLFLANMSHELRTPMNAIIGMTEQALEEPLSPGVQECLETVKGAADDLHVILNDILDFSRIEAGRLSIESAPFRLRAAVQDALRLLRLRAEQKGLTLESAIHADVPDEVVGDSLRLRQVLTNLIGNSLKFTEHGGVQVRVGTDSPCPQGACLRFEVRDTGIGIAPERLAHIFDPFTQADTSTTRKYGGTGLGLAITANLVRLMDGTIEVQSELGRGSTFRFHVRLGLPSKPVPEAEAAHTASEPGLPTRSLRILLAEDTPANQKLIVRILSKRGHTVEIAPNGQDALERVQRQSYDVVLMDVAMPVMDGLEAARAIRSLADAGKARLPVIAMTAHAMKGDRERCLAAGMNDYLAKPVDARQLTRLVERLGGTR